MVFYLVGGTTKMNRMNKDMKVGAWVKHVIVAVSASMLFVSVVNADNPIYDYRKGYYKKAYPGLKSMAEKKNKKALYYLGMMKVHGYVVPRNEEEGLRNIKQSAEKGYIKAEKFMGAYYLEEKNDPKKAFYWFKRAANKNDLLSRMYVASAYLHGYGVKQSKDMARRYITRAAQQDNALAQYQLAEIFLASKRSKSQRLGISWLKKAAKQGNQRAQYKLAMLYRDGADRLARSPEKAEEWIGKVKHHAHSDSDYLMGEYYNQSELLSERMKAIDWYQKAIASEHRDAKYKLGLMYLDPDININDRHGAFKLIESAANAGNKNAQAYLADLYEQGIGTTPSQQMADSWKNESKVTPEKERRRQTLAWLSQGEVINGLLDKEKVAGIFKHWHNDIVKKQGAINQNPSISDISKSQVFSPNLSITEPNSIKIYDLFDYIGPVHRASVPEKNFKLIVYPTPSKDISKQEVKRIYGQARVGNRDAQFKMGQLHESGTVVEKSTPLALAWYTEAASQNNLKAEYNLAMIYLYGKGVKKNYGTALYWLNRSAFKGNTEAQYALAKIYELGHGDPMSDHSISQDADRSKAMYTLAASENNPNAKLKLANFLDMEKGTQIETLSAKKKRHQSVRELYEEAAIAGIEEAKLPLAFYYASSEVPNEKKEWAYGVAREAASQGDEKASLLLGLMYDRGIGVSASRGRAVSWYETALEKDNLLAQFIMGTYYYNGDGVRAYKDKARRLLSQASDKSLPYADYNLAVIQSKNGSSFLTLMQKASSLNYNKASLYLADETLLNSQEGDSLEDAVKIYQQLAALGYPKALLKLGYMYDKGIYFKANAQKASEYYYRAAKENDPKAQYLLGNLYLLGKLGRPDINAASEWYEAAAKNAYVPSYLALGYIAENFQHNYVKATDWYKKAAEKESGLGQFNLALIYDYGKGNEPSPSEAIKWYEKAAKHNISGAKISLAKKYYLGDGVSRDEEEAYEWYKKAAKDGDAQAIYQLGLMYEAGVGTDINMTKAIGAYIKSAEKGDTAAKLALARIYQSGLGVEKDPLRALKFYEEVAKTGNIFANFQLAKYYLIKGIEKKDKDRAKKTFKSLAKKGYAPAKVAVKKLGIEEKPKKKKKDKGEEAVIVEKVIPNTPDVEDKAVASLMYIDAIKELNRGDTRQSQAVLKRITVKFPSYEPAKETLKRLEQGIAVSVPKPPAPPEAVITETPVLSSTGNLQVVDAVATTAPATSQLAPQTTVPVSDTQAEVDPVPDIEDPTQKPKPDTLPKSDSNYPDTFPSGSDGQ